ncbi:uncharacterized protein LOC131311905 [Rhododendron vialii]|uniref:uncharacterized protein LOC131311905 n=1 Tax=Rhododendron vialii TaxID=182163 RepID=UPI00265F6EA6|nr:uncharacterized protein LOC131311905 [Rhododendron vialii]
MNSGSSSLSSSSRDSWQPVMTANTATPSYWFNWRFLICFIWVLTAMVFASTLISKHEGPRGKPRRGGARRENQEEREAVGMLYADEVWKPCVKGVHPGWLLAFRAIAFFVLLVLLLLNVHVDGGDIFFFYTQWTFTLVTIYFGLGSVLSVYGCFQYQDEESRADHRVNSGEFDAERGTGAKHMGSNQEHSTRRIAGFWGYLFQIIFQMSAGAVMLTDCVFWFIIVPFLAIKDYRFNFLIVYMHSINAVFLLGDTALNCLRFPWFRIAYFFLWTAVYVIFQWIVHACVSLWWPYPFLDLSTPLAPLWYSSVALMHIPCYGIFVLIMKLKHFLFSKWFPHSYQCVVY